MGSSDEDVDAQDYKAIGIFGLVVYSVLILLATVSAIPAKYLYSRLFYCFALLHCILDIPRCATTAAAVVVIVAVVMLLWCVSLATQRTTTGRAEYACHIVANCCFSAALSTVCYIFHDITRVTVGAVFDPKKLLIGVNLALILVSIIIAGLCVSADSLADFSASPAYLLYVLIDAFAAFGLAVTVLVFGVRLLHRLQALEASAKLSTPVRRITARLILIMAICTLAFVMRCATVLVRVIVGGPRKRSVGAYLTPFGPWWWALADLLPRILAVMLFIAFLSGRSEMGGAQMFNSPPASERESEFGHFQEDSFTSKSTFSKGPHSFHSSRQDYELSESSSSYFFNADEYVSKHSDARLLSAVASSSESTVLRGTHSSATGSLT